MRRLRRWHRVKGAGDRWEGDGLDLEHFTRVRAQLLEGQLEPCPCCPPPATGTLTCTQNDTHIPCFVRKSRTHLLPAHQDTHSCDSCSKCRKSADTLHTRVHAFSLSIYSAASLFLYLSTPPRLVSHCASESVGGMTKASVQGTLQRTCGLPYDIQTWHIYIYIYMYRRAGHTP